MFEVFELQKQLVAAAAPSGYEHRVAELLRKLAKPFVDEITVDPMCSVICHKKGSGPRVMLAAHLDAIGFIVTHVDENGYAWFDRIGGHNPGQLVNCRVRFLNGAQGVIRPRDAAKTLAQPSGAIAFSDLYIDLGAKDRAEAEKVVKLGDLAIFEGEPRLVGGGNVMGPYADDLIGCVTLLLAMERMEKNDNDLYFVFTSQEEVGCRGSVTAAAGICPDYGFAVDVCGTGDKPEDEKTPMDVAVGAGPTIKIKDMSVISSPELNEKLRAVAKKNQIPYQDEILRGGGTDTCSIQKSGAGVHATCVSIPTRHIHSPAELFSISDVENAAKLLAAFVSQKL